jgi:hypothetical protein
VFFITLLQGFLLWVLNLGHRLVLAKEFDSAPVHPPFQSPPSVLQLVSEWVRSLIVLNQLCDPKVTWRKVS